MMANRLTGKTIFLTAAAAGIGKASALAFAREGAQVIASDIDEDNLARVAAEHPNIHPLQLDVTDPEAVEIAAKNAVETDVLFSLAGWVHHGTILECSQEDWEQSVSLNLTAMYTLCRAFLPAMLKKGSGIILNMSSVASSITGAPNRFAYGATKAGVIGLTKAIAADFVDQGIRCNAICPGTVDSPSLQSRMHAQGDYEKSRADFIARQPMKRIGRPEEVAALAVYLASDEAAYTTGAIHVIDGGWTI